MVFDPCRFDSVFALGCIVTFRSCGFHLASAGNGMSAAEPDLAVFEIEHFLLVFFELMDVSVQ